MYEKITAPCDRCHEPIDGFRTERETAGYYDTSSEYWQQFANEGEEKVCDRCMWTDPRYVAVYGETNALSIIVADTTAADEYT
jgi:hypothetical protein